MANILIRQYKACDKDIVRQLFCDGLRSYRDTPHLYEAEIRYSERALTQDMNDIEKHYLDIEGGNFWVAEETSEDNKGSRVVGCVGVQPLKPEEIIDTSLKSYELLRMSVHQEFRRQGLAKKLVQHLEDFVRTEFGGDEVVLFTLNEMKTACKFYEANGYQRVGELQPFTLRNMAPEATVDGTLHVQRFEKSLLNGQKKSPV